MAVVSETARADALMAALPAECRRLAPSAECFRASNHLPLTRLPDIRAPHLSRRFGLNRVETLSAAVYGAMTSSEKLREKPRRATSTAGRSWRVRESLTIGAWDPDEAVSENEKKTRRETQACAAVNL